MSYIKFDNNSIITKIDNSMSHIEQTPMVPIFCDELPNIKLYAKIEGNNPTGSIKDRGAIYVLERLIEIQRISVETPIIESSSGNFGIALAAACRKIGLQFTCVTDPHIAPTNEFLMRSFGAKIIKVDTPDIHGGYLLTRIEKIKSLLKENENLYWVNQYSNPMIVEAYAETLGTEICKQKSHIDYIFVGVSSGGTISGICHKLRELSLSTTVIPVDTVGSIIFGKPPKKRYIPGIGSSMVPDHFKYFKIENPVMVEEADTVQSCRELLEQHCMFLAGSSGTVFHAVKQFFNEHPLEYIPEVVAIFADRGERYMDTVYNDAWCKECFCEVPMIS